MEIFENCLIELSGGVNRLIQWLMAALDTGEKNTNHLFSIQKYI